jgi:hypothetical protein
LQFQTVRVWEGGGVKERPSQPISQAWWSSPVIPAIAEARGVSWSEAGPGKE